MSVYFTKDVTHGTVQGETLKRSTKSAPSVRQAIKFYYVNARSIRNKLRYLEDVAYLEDYILIGITEW